AHKMHTEGLCIAMMPEGTRNKEGKGLLPFKKGPFHLAILAQVPIIPVVSSPLKDIASWKYKVLKGGTIHMTVLPPIPTKGMTDGDVDRLSNTVREKMLAVLKKYEA